MLLLVVLLLLLLLLRLALLLLLLLVSLLSSLGATSWHLCMLHRSHEGAANSVCQERLRSSQERVRTRQLLFCEKATVCSRRALKGISPHRAHVLWYEIRRCYKPAQEL